MVGRHSGGHGGRSSNTVEAMGEWWADTADAPLDLVSFKLCGLVLCIGVG